MKRLVIAAAFIAIVAVAIVYVTAGGTPPSTDSAEARIDDLYAEWNKPDSPGCSVGVSRNGAVVHERGFGMASIELGVPITPASAFPVASVSKQFTAMSVALLAQRGQLSLDDEVRKYVTELPDYGTPLTIRHLLTHTSGLRESFGLDGWSAPRQDGSDPNDALVRILARQRGLNFTPGTQFQYNNGGYNLLAILVRRASGQPLRQFAEANIFKPLGMTQTRFVDDVGLLIPNRVSNYWRDARGFHPGSEAPGVIGNSGLYSTVGDLLRWEKNFVDTQVGNPALLTAMQTPTTLTSGVTVPYGFGLGIGEHRGLRVIDHGGGDRGISTHLARYPAHDLAIAVLCNSDSIPAGPLNQRIAEAVLSEVLGPSPAPAPATTTTPQAVSLTAEQLATYTGWYRHATSGLLRVSVRDGNLALNDIEGDNVDSPLTAIGSNEFVLLIDGTVFARMAFASNGSGQGEMRFAPPPGKKEGQAFERLRSGAMSPADLQSFAGDYLSEELDTTYIINARDGKLILRNPGKPDSVVEDIGNDIFAGNIVGIVRFSRDARGRVTGFTISRRLVQGVRFDRVR